MSEEIDEWHRWLILERRFNRGSPSGFTTSTSSATAPNMLDSGYPLPYGMLPFEDVVVVGTEFGGTSLKGLGADRLFPFHPDHVGAACLDVSGYIADVSPTASGRTVAIADPGAGRAFIKLHYPGVIGRFQRDLPLYKWLHALTMDRICEEARPDGSIILSEKSGGFWRGPTSPGCGYLIRQADRISRDAVVIPAFSYLWSDTDGTRPIAKWVLERHGVTPLALSILLVRVYFDLALDYGLLPECNAQNVLFAFRNGEVEVVFRDLNDFFVDAGIRQNMGMETPTVVYKQINYSSPDRFERRSFSFDFKLGNYILAPLADVSAELCGISHCAFDRHIVEHFRGRADTEYFPEAAYGYPQITGVDRGSYVHLGSPRFR